MERVARPDTYGRQQFAVFQRFLLVFAVMYIADLGFTLYGLKAGLVVEANPLMRMVLNHSLAAAIILKLGLLAVFVVAVSLCFRVNRRLAVWAVGLASGAYGIVVLWHVINLVYSGAIWLP